MDATIKFRNTIQLPFLQLFTANQEATESVSKRQIKEKSYSQDLMRLLRKNLITSHFQPIVSLEHGDIFAYEALCRTIGENPFSSIDELFKEALNCDRTLQLDMLCRQTAINLAARQGIDDIPPLLFLNICPSSLLHPEHNAGTTETFASRHGVSKQKIVLEITEQQAVHNYPLFTKAIDHYRARGFRIAIDDFGAGYGGLKMLSMLEPDFVKIDRHFFKEHSKSSINYNLIDSIATACHRIGIEVIAEGIETERDLQICKDLGIDLLQGYYFAKPDEQLVTSESIKLKPHPSQNSSATKLFDEVICVGDIARFEPPVDVEERVLGVLQRFQDTTQLHCIPVINKGRLAGLINRHRFMEKHMVGRHGYGLNLNYYKKVGDVLDDSHLQVPYYESVEEVAKKIHLRQQVSVYDDVCITKSGKYIGVVAVSDILNAVTENSMMLAKGANPLTGLPGNEFIQRQISKMLSQSLHFDVCYIDIDNFKPFNDRHGFEVGDRVIKKLGDIMIDGLRKWEKGQVGFAGHIGGDDFILIARPRHSVEICTYIIDQFSKARSKFHTEEECRNDCYLSVDRQGEKRQFGLISLSIGIVSTEIHHISSFAEISSIATDLKKRAKNREDSVIVRDRRAGASEPG